MKKGRARCVMVLPDLHIPHHDRAALACVERAYTLLKPDEVVILGDWLDCEAFSAHPKTSLAELQAHKFIDDELRPCRELLDRLQKHGNALTYIEGNHEARIERFAVSPGGSLGPDLYALISPRAIFGEGRKRWTALDVGAVQIRTGALRNHARLVGAAWVEPREECRARTSRPRGVRVRRVRSHASPAKRGKARPGHWPRPQKLVAWLPVQAAATVRAEHAHHVGAGFQHRLYRPQRRMDGLHRDHSRWHVRTA